MEHMLKSFGTHHPKPPFSSRLPQPPETTKPAKRRALRCSNMAEAMGFELMDLLQSTVFKTDIKATAGRGLKSLFLSETCNIQHLYRLHFISPLLLVSELISTPPGCPSNYSKFLHFHPLLSYSSTKDHICRTQI